MKTRFERHHTPRSREAKSWEKGLSRLIPDHGLVVISGFLNIYLDGDKPPIETAEDQRGRAKTRFCLLGPALLWSGPVFLSLRKSVTKARCANLRANRVAAHRLGRRKLPWAM